MKYASPGEPLHIEAGPFNDALDAGADYVRRKRNALSGNVSGDFQDGTLILVQNNGPACDRFDALGIDGSLISPSVNLSEWSNRVILACSLPRTDTHDGKFVIAQEPIASGAIGRAVISGVTNAKVTVSYTTGTATTAGVSNRSGFLEAGGSGAEILWREPGFGNKLAVIRLSPSQSGHKVVQFQTVLVKDTSLSTGEFRANDSGVLAYSAYQGIDPQVVGITHEPTASSPGTNGNFTVGVAAWYRFSFHWTLTRSGLWNGVTPPYTDIPTQTANTSTDSGHYHTYTVAQNINGSARMVAYKKTGSSSFDAMVGGQVDTPILGIYNYETLTTSGCTSWIAQLAVGDALMFLASYQHHSGASNGAKCTSSHLVVERL